MERLPGKIEFVYGKEYLELKWNSVNTSPEMVIDAIDSFGPIFFNYFESSYVNFLDSAGHLTNIDEIVYTSIPLVYVRGPDGKKNKFPMEFPMFSDISQQSFLHKRYFSITNCKLSESIPPLQIALSELSLHKSKKDCWLSLGNKVYNITSYVPHHPGGSIILQGAGKDATSLFNSHHRHINFESILSKYYVGTLSPNNFP